MPDLHHYKGSFGGRVFPLWRDRAASVPNLPPNLLAFLEKRYTTPVSEEDLMAYIAAVAAHPAYTARFQDDLAQPGLRIPLTAKKKLFANAVELGRTIIWLHTFGERCADPRMVVPPSHRGWRRIKPRAFPPPGRSRKTPRPCPARSAMTPARSAFSSATGISRTFRPRFGTTKYQASKSCRNGSATGSGTARSRPWATSASVGTVQDSAGIVARGVHHGIAQRRSHSWPVGGVGESSRRVARENLFGPNHHGRGIARRRGACRAGRLAEETSC